MGIVICDKHGRRGFVETCSHIAVAMDEGRLPGGRRLQILGQLFVCDDCFIALELKKFSSLTELSEDEMISVTDGRWEAFEEAYNAIEGRRGFCLECVAELEASQHHLSAPGS
jgi:hypothetical protein